MGKEPGLQQFGEGAETLPRHCSSPILIPKTPKTAGATPEHILGFAGQV